MPNDPQIAAEGILIVEDEDKVADLLAEAVMGGGWRLVGPAATLEEARELLSGERVAAAVLDFIVASEYIDLFATELTERGIPFAVTTGIMGRDRAKKRFSPAPVIIKPFQTSFVTQVIGELLGVRRYSN